MPSFRPYPNFARTRSCTGRLQRMRLCLPPRRNGAFGVVGEIYPDLTYSPEGALIVQREMHAADLDFVASQVSRFIECSQVAATDGSLIELEAESICLHGRRRQCHGSGRHDSLRTHRQRLRNRADHGLTKGLWR